MKPSEIKRLAETYSAEQLQAAELCILEETALPENLVIEGEDDGERLTHISAALFVLGEVAKGALIKDAIRAFSARVRESIS